mgnify:CR=1 FL=1
MREHEEKGVRIETTSKSISSRPRISGQTRKNFAGPWESIPTTLNFADLEAKYKGNCKPVNATRQGNSSVRTRAPVTFRHGTRQNLAVYRYRGVGLRSRSQEQRLETRAATVTKELLINPAKDELASCSAKTTTLRGRRR